MYAAHRSIRQLAGATIAVLALAAASAGCGGGNQPGKILFATDIPSGTAACVPAKAVTTAGATGSVYATYNFKSKPDTGAVTVEILKDGASILKVDLPASTTKGLDCLADTTDLSQVPGWGAGTIKVVATYNGSEIASGELTVTP